MARDPRAVVVLTSGPSESEAAEPVGVRPARLAGPALAERILRIGEFDLVELRALIGRAALYIGGDSGPLHIAGTTRTPVVGLFGPTLAVRSLPWRDPAVPALGVEPGAAGLPPVRSARVRAGRFPVSDAATPAANA